MVLTTRQKRVSGYFNCKKFRKSPKISRGFEQKRSDSLSKTLEITNENEMEEIAVWVNEMFGRINLIV